MGKQDLTEEQIASALRQAGTGHGWPARTGLTWEEWPRRAQFSTVLFNPTPPAHVDKGVDGRRTLESAASSPAAVQSTAPERLLIAIARNTASTGTSNRLA